MDQVSKQLIQQQQALHRISKLALEHYGNWPLFLESILPITCHMMQCAQASVWLLKANNSLLACECHYQAKDQNMSLGQLISACDMPAYFDALTDGRCIDAHDARNDPRTSEFTESYLIPQGITSMLDAALKKQGEVVGVICFEHIGPAIQWSEVQMGFAAAVADQINLILLQNDMELAIRHTRDSEKRFQLAAEMTNDIIIDWRPNNHHLYISPMMSAALHHSSQNMLRLDDLIQLIHPDDRPLLNCKHGDHSFSHHWELRIQHADGHWVWSTLRLRLLYDSNGRLTSILGVLTLIDERKRYEQQLEYEASHDPLTGLPNRNHGLNQIQDLLDHPPHTDKHFALLYMDLDRFKLINDTLGHTTGDRVLRIFSHTLIKHTKNLAYIARLGGDEFMVILPDIKNIHDAMQQAQQIKQACAKPVMIDGREFHLAASIGIVLSDHRYSRAEDMLADADIAMYASKATDAAPKLFSDNMRLDMAQRLNLEQELKRASFSEHFEIHYQPVLRSEDGCIKGLEALIRWRHPKRGLLTPGYFLDIADESGMIIPMGYWMLHQICEHLKEFKTLQKKNDLCCSPWISLNLSATQMNHSALFDQIHEALEIHQVDPSHLKLEISEGAGTEDLDQLKEVHDRLKELKIGLLIDDFGTGHSSLSRLREFSFEAIKIDRSILGTPEQTEKNLEFLQAVINISKALGTETILEGVEVKEQMELAQRMGVDSVQGYYIGRPSLYWEQWLKRPEHRNTPVIPT